MGYDTELDALAASYPPDRIAQFEPHGVTRTFNAMAGRFDYAKDGFHFITNSTTANAKVCIYPPIHWKTFVARLDDPASGYHLSRSFFCPYPAFHRELYTFERGIPFYLKGAEPSASVCLDMCAAAQVDGIFLFPKQQRYWVRQLLASGHPYRFPYLYVAGTLSTFAEMSEYQDKLGGHAGTFLAYGCTEKGLIGFGSYDPARPGAIKKIASDVQVTIDNGEVAITSPLGATSYLDNPQATAKQFRNGMFYPTDLGHFDGDGALVLTGRL